MKVAILSPKKYEEAETFIQNHIKNLPFEVIVIYGGSFPYISEKQIPTKWDTRLHLLKRKLKLTTQSFKESNLTEILKKEKVDLVFAEYLITGAETVAVCKKLNIPLIAIALGYDISRYNVIEKYKQKYKALFKYAKSIMVVSQHMRTNIENLGCPSEKIMYSPAGPATDFFEITPNFSNNQVVAIGRFVDKKAPHLSILAFKKVLQQIPNAILVMAGDGPLLNASKDLVEALKISDSIKFVGRINREQHKEFLQESIIFIQHSKIAENGDSEGTPVAILEASAAGLPVVSTIHAGIPDVVIHNKTGLLCKEQDVDAMAENIIKLLEDKSVAIAMGKAGKKYVQQNFSLDRHIEVLQHVMEAAVLEE